MIISQILQENEPQPIRKIYDKSKEYKDVVDFPDIPIPDTIKKAATAADAFTKRCKRLMEGFANISGIYLQRRWLAESTTTAKKSLRGIMIYLPDCKISCYST